MWWWKMRPARFARAFLPVALLVAQAATAQTPVGPTGIVVPARVIPDWALPDSPTHKQVAPPPDFHRDAITYNEPVGIFVNQTDVGAALVPGDARYDPADKSYTITSGGYNIWYTRDEFRYLWKRMSGNVSLAASVSWPDPSGFGDRKAALVIRQDLKDDSVEALVAQHGAGMVHLARREVANTRIKDMEYRAGSRGGLPGGATPDSLVALPASRIGIEKNGDQFQLWISWQGEKMHPEGAPITLHLNGPFYVGIGFASHLPATISTAKVSNVVLENRAGAIR
jgi:hypothetical protein